MPANPLDAALSGATELSGVLNRALEVLPSIRKNGLSESTSTRGALEEFREATDPFAAWLDRETLLKPRAFVAADQLWTAYNQECEAKGRPFASKTAVGSAMAVLRPNIQKRQRTVNGERRLCYIGIGLITREP